MHQGAEPNRTRWLPPYRANVKPGPLKSPKWVLERHSGSPAPRIKRGWN